MTSGSHGGPRARERGPRRVRGRLRTLIALASAFVLAGGILPGPASASPERAAVVAPALVPDRVVRFSPSAEHDARAVLLVHGWLSTSLPGDIGTAEFADSPFARPVQWRDGSGRPAPRGFEASLQTRLEALPDVAVYAFDYSANSSAWVGSASISQHLGDAIRQVAASVDGPVDVVTHSMGGLALRYTLDRAPDLAPLLGEIVTVGTPTLGSDIANLAVDIHHIVQVTISANPVLRNLVLPTVGALCDAELMADARGGCDLPPVIRTGIAALGEGGTALRAGSDQLEHLPDWPAGVSVHAIAGSAVVSLPLPGTARLDVRLGDGLVAEHSAVADAERVTVVSCATTLPPGVDGLVLAATGGVAAPPFGGPCAHDALFTNLEVVDAVLAALSRHPAASPRAGDAAPTQAADAAPTPHRIRSSG